MAVAMKGLRLKPTYEDLINVAVSDELYNIKFPNRNAQFLRNGFILCQLDGEGARIMEKQQEMASKHAFKESLLKQIAINTGSKSFDLRSDSHQEMRDERIREFSTPSRPSQPEAYDPPRDDFTPFDTPSPFYETPALSDYSDRINRRLDFEEQEQINASNRQQNKREQMRQEASQHLADHSQPKRRVDIDIKNLTRSYLDRVYLNTIDKVQAKDCIKKEFERVEKASGSRDTQNHGEGNLESTIEPKGKQGRPPKYTNTDEKFWKNEKLKTLVNEFNTITSENVEINKVGKKKQKHMPLMVMR